jgi:uncharacterized protein
MKNLSTSDLTPEQRKAVSIEFPCAYPIKVVGSASAELHQLVITVMQTHTEQFDQRQITVRDSSSGRWQSITITITATGEEQLAAIFADLKASPLVQMVL